MPPRFAYWTILVGGLPTAFRSAEREEIEPTFRRLQHKHPDAQLRWFARGKLWASPQEAREASEKLKAASHRQSFPDRDRNWRPGGAHRDPRQPYKDAKKRENQRRRERRFEFKQKEATGPPRGTDQRPGQEPKRWERPRPKWGQERPDWRKPQGTGRKPEQKPWQRPDRDGRPKAKSQGPGDERRAWERPAPKWRPREESRRKPHDTGPKDDQKPWQRPAPKWKPRDEAGSKWSSARREGPKTEDRRPKAQGSGRGRTRGNGGGARKGPGKGGR
jgi:hypothetical protein